MASVQKQTDNKLFLKMLDLVVLPLLITMRFFCEEEVEWEIIYS